MGKGLTSVRGIPGKVNDETRDDSPHVTLYLPTAVVKYRL